MNVPRTKSVVNLVLMSVLAWSASGRCDDGGDARFYVGVGIGGAQISDNSVYIDDSSAAYKALFGYNITRVFSLEGTVINLDDYVSYDPFVTDSQHAVANGRGINAAAVLHMPVTRRVDLMARAGILLWNAESQWARIDESGTDPSFGIGIAVRLTDVLSIRAEYDVLRFDDVHVAVGTAVLEYRF